MIKKNCISCHHFVREEIGDSDFGGVYAEEPSCALHKDIDSVTEEPIIHFDKEIERDCCELDFWFVLDKDKELEDVFIDEVNMTGSFNKTYEMFKEKYLS